MRGDLRDARFRNEIVDSPREPFAHLIVGDGIVIPVLESHTTKVEHEFAFLLKEVSVA